MKAILSNPPVSSFFGPKTLLGISSAPVSQMLLTSDSSPSGREDASAAYVRTYSSASESSVFSPSNSMSSAQMGSMLSRDMSRESVDSSADTPLEGRRYSGSDPESSWSCYQQQRSRAFSSTSSDGGGGYGPSSVPPGGGINPRKDRPSSGNLFSVPEHRTGVGYIVLSVGEGFPTTLGLSKVATFHTSFLT